MLRTNWNKYFTPPDLSEQLIKEIDGCSPGNVVDICAGSGNLLLAARRRWPKARLEGNDLYKDATNKFAAWSKKDGRQFALDRYIKNQHYDLVVANPPFGYCASGDLFSNIDSVCHETRYLLRSPKMECSMTVASALLVSKKGTLATIVPETLVFGETYLQLRQWLGSQFKKFKVQRIKRGDFENEDLGLVFLAAYKDIENRGHDDYIELDQSCGNQNQLSEGIEIARGLLISSQTTTRGGTLVVHCGGKSSEQGYIVRRCHNSVAKRDHHLWVRQGDIIVSRIGRMAGVASVYNSEIPAIMTDCIYRIKFRSQDSYFDIRRKIESGKFNNITKDLARGLGAKYITKSDLYTMISMFTST